MTMDVRKSETSSSIPYGKRVAIGSWLGEVKEEFKKITWTNKEELKLYTKIVVGATFIVGLGIYLLDLAAQGTLSGVGALVKAIAG